MGSACSHSRQATERLSDSRRARARSSCAIAASPRATEAATVASWISPRVQRRASHFPQSATPSRRRAVALLRLRSGSDLLVESFPDTASGVSTCGDDASARYKSFRRLRFFASAVNQHRAARGWRPFAPTAHATRPDAIVTAASQKPAGLGTTDQ
jgi:hypothetical protein